MAALTAAAALCTGLLVAAHSAQQQDVREAAAEARPSAAPTPAASLTITGAVPHRAAAVPTSSSATAAGEGAAAVGVASGPITVRYTFDDGAGHPMYSTSGRYPLRIVTAAGGTIRFVTRGTGYAVRFPARCTSSPSSCPRAILQGSRADALNPGRRAVRYGAGVRMTSSDTGDGANVLQKGYSVGGYTQFKLQVDGRAGRPSCVIASPTKIYRVVAAAGVADGRWHNLACVRSGSRLGITVDGAGRGSVYVPTSLSIANSEPLRVGGKGVNPGNDQFAGMIDDVFIRIS